MSTANAPAHPAILEVSNLRKHYPTRKHPFSKASGYIRAVDGVSFSIAPGEILGLVGESGCGKTTVGRSILRLTEPTAGSVRFEGTEITSLSSREMRRVRRHMQIVFQDPLSSLNPRLTVGQSLAEPLAIHRLMRGHRRDARVTELLELVGLSGAYSARYPHELSGGQRQRVGIARALAVGPRLIVADEAVSALDVSVRAQVVNLLLDLRERLGLAYIFISHDLALVDRISDRVAVMYAGRIVEMVPRGQLWQQPHHPYTVALLSAIPVTDPAARRHRIMLQGDPPSASSPPGGCRFHTRCYMAEPICAVDEPALREAAPGHWAACHFSERAAVAARPIS